MYLHIKKRNRSTTKRNIKRKTKEVFDIYIYRYLHKHSKKKKEFQKQRKRKRPNPNPDKMILKL